MRLRAERTNAPSPDALELAAMIVRAFEHGPIAGERKIELRYNGYLHCAARRITKAARRVAKGTKP